MSATTQARPQTCTEARGRPSAHQPPQQQQLRRASVASHPSRRRHRAAAVRVEAVFTGIVQGRARVVAAESRPGFSHLTLEFPRGTVDTARMGASIAINGTCLTVVQEASAAAAAAAPSSSSSSSAGAGPDRLAFDVIAETLRATTLGDLRPGDEVNFERAARVGDEIGGHSVSGHVHATAAVAAVERAPDNVRVTLRLEGGADSAARWSRYVLPKGYVAVDGCSLTVGEVEGDAFSVYLIPETLRVTTLGRRAAAFEQAAAAAAAAAAAGAGAGAAAAAGGGDDGGGGGGGGKGLRCNIEVEAQTQAVVDTVERVLGAYVSQAVGGGAGPLAEAVRAVVGVSK
jgi:riboflavin synthase